MRAFFRNLCNPNLRLVAENEKNASMTAAVEPKLCEEPFKPGRGAVTAEWQKRDADGEGARGETPSKSDARRRD
jgi:hypothetical protein